MEINELSGKIKIAQQMMSDHWAIEKNQFDQIRTMYANFEKDPKAFLEVIEMDEAPEILSFEDNVAYIDISGPMVNKHNCATIFFGCCSYLDIIEAIDKVSEMDNVEKVIFNVDSPGGMVTGCDNCSQAIAAMEIPTEARIDNMAASAAYWIASQCDSIVATSLTSSFGSIGVVIEYWDTTKANELQGFTKVVITSDNAPNKRLDALDEDDRRKIKSGLTEIEEIFIRRVAEGRKVTRSDVLAKFGQGGMVLAEKSIEAGMIDNIEIITNNSIKSSETVSEENMSLKELLEKNPEAKNELDAHVKAEVKKEVSAALAKDAEERTSVIEKTEKYFKADYPTQVTELAVKVLKGESSIEALETTVTTIDAINEKNNSAAAQDESKVQGDTPAQVVKEQVQGENASTISDEESLKAQSEKLKSY